MLSLLITAATGLVGPKWAKPLVYAALALAAVGIFFGAKALYDHSVVAHHDAKVEQRAKPATDQAANERATDAITTAKKEEELHNVIAAQPDQPIAPTSRALACKRLSNAGKHPTACR